MEVDINQAIQMLRAEEMRAKELGDRINQSVSLLTELKVARATLENLPEEDTQTLLPIGGGILLPSVASKKAKVLINVGAGVVLEKEVQGAIGFLDKRIGLLENTINELSSALNKANKNISILRSKVESAIREAQINQPPVIG